MIATRVPFTAAVLLLVSNAGSLTAQTRSYTVDLENRYANVGAALVVVGPNDFGIPTGIGAMSSGTLIHPQVFMVAGHFTGPGALPLPPFLKVYVSLAPNARDPSSWIPITAQITHPSLPPCPPPAGCDPTTTGVFTAGDPSFTDLGLVFLARPVENIKPAKLASPGRLEKNQTQEVPMTTVGYGDPTCGPRRDISMRDGFRKYRSSKVAQILNGQWASWELPTAVRFGDSGAPTFFDNLADVSENHQTVVAVASDGGIDCISKDIRTRVDTLAVHQWIRDTIKQQLGVDVDLEAGER